MSRSVSIGARLSAPAGESLPELATDVLSKVHDAIGVREGWIRPLELLQNLAPRD